MRVLYRNHLLVAWCLLLVCLLRLVAWLTDCCEELWKCCAFFLFLYFSYSIDNRSMVSDCFCFFVNNMAFDGRSGGLGYSRTQQNNKVWGRSFFLNFFDIMVMEKFLFLFVLFLYFLCIIISQKWNHVYFHPCFTQKKIYVWISR